MAGHDPSHASESRLRVAHALMPAPWRRGRQRRGYQGGPGAASKLSTHGHPSHASESRIRVTPPSHASASRIRVTPPRHATAGVGVLGWARSRIFVVYYFRVYLALVLAGLLFGLGLLPVLLALLGPPPRPRAPAPPPEPPPPA